MTWFNDFWSIVYDHRRHLWLFAMFMVFLFVLNLLSFALGHQSVESQAVAYFNLAIIGVTTSTAVALYWYSTKREHRY